MPGANSESVKLQGTVSLRRELPLWAQRLNRTAADLRGSRGPGSPAEGLRQAVELADLGWRQILSRLRAQHPDLTPDQLDEVAYRNVEAWKSQRDRLRFRSDR